MYYNCDDSKIATFWGWRDFFFQELQG
jgi:hypothetical protein